MQKPLLTKAKAEIKEPVPTKPAASNAAKDGQIIERRGRHRLIDEFLQARLEVALPIRDRGVDLLVYADLTTDAKTFTARPIQMKAASGQSFGLDQKYSRFPDLIIAYVWNLANPERAVTYAVTYNEAVEIADSMEWTATPSWVDGGAYVTNAPSVRLLHLLEPHRMTPETWRHKIMNGANGARPNG